MDFLRFIPDTSGVSVIKSLAQRLVVRGDLTELTIVTGNRSEAEVLYRDFFEDLALRDARVSLRFVISNPHNPAQCERVGRIPQHIDGYDFTQADVYICGQTSACNVLRTEIERGLREDTTSFFVEAF